MSGIWSPLASKGEVGFLVRGHLPRFLLAGAVNTAFGFAVFSLLTVIGAGAAAALAFGTVAGVLFNFITYGAYAFRDLTLARLPRFCVAYGLVYCLNLVLLSAMASIPMDRIVSQALLTPPMALLAFFLMKRFVFVGARAE